MSDDMSDPDKLRLLADWLDVTDRPKGIELDEAQRDLRRMAAEMEHRTPHRRDTNAIVRAMAGADPWTPRGQNYRCTLCYREESLLPYRAVSTWQHNEQCPVTVARRVVAEWDAEKAGGETNGRA